jgi:hypothetical protein
MATSASSLATLTIGTTQRTTLIQIVISMAKMIVLKGQPLAAASVRWQAALPAF